MNSSLTRKTLAALTTGLVVIGAAAPGSAAGRAGADASADRSPAGTAEPSGPFCPSIPAAGEGSFVGMADDTVAIAASNNPYLTTLASAVQAAGLTDTLNGPGPFTILAPSNEAFSKIPPADLDAILSDPEWLNMVLLYHVIPGERLSADDLVERGTLATADGMEVQVTQAANGAVTINGGAATIICANIFTSNATVHVIDTVISPLLPPMR